MSLKVIHKQLTGTCHIKLTINHARFMQVNHKERSGVIENAEESQNNYHKLAS